MGPAERRLERKRRLPAPLPLDWGEPEVRARLADSVAEEQAARSGPVQPSRRGAPTGTLRRRTSVRPREWAEAAAGPAAEAAEAMVLPGPEEEGEERPERSHASRRARLTVVPEPLPGASRRTEELAAMADLRRPAIAAVEAGLAVEAEERST